MPMLCFDNYLYVKKRFANMWILTFKTLCGPVRMASKIFQTRLEAMAGARKLRQFTTDKTDDGQYLAGTGLMHGVEYMWSVEQAVAG
jgi:hypothetical protein